MEAEARFCLRCGAVLQAREIAGQLRPACPRCTYVHFLDPKVAAGVVAARDGEILLTRRNQEPHRGGWSFPSGFVDAGEDVRVAAVRETLEETGITVQIETLLGVYQEPGSRVIYIAFAASAGPGEPVGDAESMEVRFFPADELPEMAFLHDQAILDAWRTSRGSQAQVQMHSAAKRAGQDEPAAKRLTR